VKLIGFDGFGRLQILTDFSIRVRLLVGHFTSVLSRFAVLLVMKELWGLWQASFWSQDHNSSYGPG
jgi:hypothetical protein